MAVTPAKIMNQSYWNRIRGPDWYMCCLLWAVVLKDFFIIYYQLFKCQFYCSTNKAFYCLIASIDPLFYNFYLSRVSCYKGGTFHPAVSICTCKSRLPKWGQPGVVYNARGLSKRPIRNRFGPRQTQLHNS
jgi:hypothetical protein